MRKKILLDTDIGSDIDDCLALAYLLKEPDCEILGITTVSGEADKRAAMVDAICRNVGITDMPIFRERSGRSLGVSGSDARSRRFA